MNLSIEQFNPTVEELNSLANSASALPLIKGIHDTPGIEAKRQKKKELVKARTTIKRIGKSMRDEANAFNKAVLSKEKELLAIIAPYEDEIKAELDEVDRLTLIEERRLMLPNRRADMDELGVQVTDDELLSMDSAQYSEYKAGKTQEKLDAERQALEDERRELQEQQAAIARQQEIEEAKKKAAAQAVADAELAAKRKAEEEARARQEAEEKARKNKKYQDWLGSFGEERPKIERDGNTFIAYKEISRITIE